MHFAGLGFDLRRIASVANKPLVLTAQSLRAWVPSLRSAAAQRRRYTCKP